MKGVCSIPNNEIYNAAGWNIKSKKNIVLKGDGTFTIMTSVKTIFGCFEGTPKHVVRMPQEFSFHRGSGNLNNCLVTSLELKGYEIKITSLCKFTSSNL